MGWREFTLLEREDIGEGDRDLFASGEVFANGGKVRLVLRKQVIGCLADLLRRLVLITADGEHLIFQCLCWRIGGQILFIGELNVLGAHLFVGFGMHPIPGHSFKNNFVVEKLFGFFVSEAQFLESLHAVGTKTFQESLRMSLSEILRSSVLASARMSS